MALRAKVRGQMRNVSPAMARRLRARGVAVVDMCPPEPTALLAPHQVAFVAGTPANMTPEQPVPNMVATVVEMTETVDALIAGEVENPVDVIADIASKGWGDPDPTVDLSDEELEKLTAPES